MKFSKIVVAVFPLLFVGTAAQEAGASEGGLRKARQLRASKIEVCHKVGEGEYRKITIADPAFPTHVAHGDGQPGSIDGIVDLDNKNAVPGMEGYFFDPECGLFTQAPSSSPSESPSESPSSSPSATPSSSPSKAPSSSPSAIPSASPSKAPSSSPSAEPSVNPSKAPSSSPSVGPSASPSKAPSIPCPCWMDGLSCDGSATNRGVLGDERELFTWIYGATISASTFPGYCSNTPPESNILVEILPEEEKACRDEVLSCHAEIGGPCEPYDVAADIVCPCLDGFDTNTWVTSSAQLSKSFSDLTETYVDLYNVSQKNIYLVHTDETGMICVSPDFEADWLTGDQIKACYNKALGLAMPLLQEKGLCPS